MTNSINDYTNLEQHLLNDFQRDLSLSTTPYADMARQLGVSEEEVLLSINSLQEQGMSVPAESLECVARIVSAFPEVNHNYERDHEYNLWFVVTACSEEHLDIVLYEIEQHTEYSLMSLPMLEDYFIDLGFQLKQANKS